LQPSSDTLPAQTQKTPPGQIGGALGKHGLTAAISAGEPVEVDKALRALLPQHLNSSLKWKSVSEMEVRGTADQEELKTGLGLVIQSFKPMAQDQIVKLLLALRLKTASRETDQVDMKMLLATYADELKQYPADVVQKVLSTQHQHSKWWPTWMELQERLNLYTADRRALRRVLERAVK